MSTLSLSEVKAVVKELLKRYHAEYALLFGSYARGDATPDSDIDIIIVGGKDFVPRNIFALAEDLREMTGRYSRKLPAAPRPALSSGKV